MDYHCLVNQSFEKKGRIFIREGSLMEKDKKSSKERYCFLFSDILLHLKKKKDKFSFKGKTNLHKAIVADIPDTKSTPH